MSAYKSFARRGDKGSELLPSDMCLQKSSTLIVPKRWYLHKGACGECCESVPHLCHAASINLQQLPSCGRFGLLGSSCDCDGLLQ